jgi:lysophospholipase
VRSLFSGLVMILALAGCNRETPKPYPESRVPPMLAPRYFAPDGWAWGTVAAQGLAPVRYGVTGPSGAPRAHVVIAAGPEENAEVYFETVRDLQAKGYVVWVLDAAPTPSAGAQALRVLIDQVVRPKSHEVLVLAAAQAAVVPILIEAETPGPRLDGIFLWSPILHDPFGDEARRQTGLGFGGFAASGQHDWTRPNYDLSGRATLVEAWRTANPDLRPGKRSWSWFAAQAEGAELASAPIRLKSVGAPVLLVEGRAESRAENLCAGIARCERRLISGAEPPLHLAPDDVRARWLDAFTGFVESAIVRTASIHAV